MPTEPWDEFVAKHVMERTNDPVGRFRSGDLPRISGDGMPGNYEEAMMTPEEAIEALGECVALCGGRGDDALDVVKDVVREAVSARSSRSWLDLGVKARDPSSARRGRERTGIANRVLKENVELRKRLRTRASAVAVVTNVRRSWDFDPETLGRSAVRRHGEALRRLGDAALSEKEAGA